MEKSPTDSRRREPPVPPSKTKTRSAGATPFWIVFLPFAFGHYVSFFYRSVNAVLAPPLTAALHLSATQLGLLSSTYFLAFALAQLPVGLALDRYGPRRVQRVLLCVAAIGALLFAHGRSVAALCMARALIGLGVSACFMGAIKAVSYWVEPRRLPSIHSYLIAVGGCGAMSATLPVETLLYAIGWRGLFVVLALATLTAAGIIHCCAPREPAPDTARASTAARPTLRSLLDVYRHPAFRRTTALLLMPHAVAFGLQGLWIGQWLRDAGGLSDDAVAKLLCVGMAAIVVGSLSVGALTEWAGRFGIEPLDVGGIGTALFVLVQVLAMSGAVPLMPALSVAFTLCGTVAGLEYTIVA